MTESYDHEKARLRELGMDEVLVQLLNHSVVSNLPDPYPMFAELRRYTPVARIELPNRTIYMVLRYDDVCTVLKDPETFSSTIIRQVMGPVMGCTILEMDGRAHTIHRGLVSHAFQPNAIERYSRRLVEPLAAEMVDRVRRGGSRAELVRQLTMPFPLAVITRMLGLPVEDFRTFQEWSLAIIDYRPERPEKGLSASRALRAYITPIIHQRRAEPRDDLISELARAEIEGHKLTDDEILAFCLLLLPAGAETTVRLLGNTLFALLAHPDQLEEVHADPSLLRCALEEALRWEPPLLGTARMATRDVEMSGTRIPKGSMVSAMIGPANRDPEHYPEPDRFDMHRRPSDHLAFGLGKHFCLGYHLARLEVLTVVRMLLDTFPNLRLDPNEDSHIQGFSFRSPNQLVVRL